MQSSRLGTVASAQPRRFGTIAGAGLLLGVVIACGSPEQSAGSNVDRFEAPSLRAVPATSTSTTETPTTNAPTTTAPAITLPSFDASVAPLDQATRNRVEGVSWRAGCPVPVEQLRYLRVTHWTDADGTASGELIVNERVADEVVEVFRSLFDSRFPIHSMRLVDEFDGDDLASMQANNTSAFNCRNVADTSSLSWHAYGLAIDINPLVNPYVTRSGVSPPEGALFVDRASDTPGLITAGDVVNSAFDRAGWSWGGTWQSPDYQHFARPDDAG